MEGDTSLENTDRRGVLNRSSSDVSALTAVNVKQGDNKVWTDAKHILYLNRLEMSFVTQLNQSKELPIRSSDQGQRSVDTCQDVFADINNDSDQFTVLRNGCWLKIKYQKNGLFSRTSAYSVTRCNKSTTVVSFKSRDVQTPSLAGLHKLKRFCETEQREKETAPHALSKISSISDDSVLWTKEGTGQNFQDDDSLDRTIIDFPAKRLRTASAETQDHHVVPSRKSSGTETN